MYRRLKKMWNNQPSSKANQQNNHKRPAPQPQGTRPQQQGPQPGQSGQKNQPANKTKPDIPEDVEYKERGNKFFADKQYFQAIVCYTFAINKDPLIPVYHTNRALARLKVKRFQEAADDCKAVLLLDANNIKGHYFLGQALCELHMLDEGVEHLQKAVDLIEANKTPVSKEMTELLQHWKKERFENQENKEISEESELKAYLTRLANEDRDKEIEAVKEKFKIRGIIEGAELNEEINFIETLSQTYMAEMNGLFDRVDDRRKRREVPDYLCGKISLELFKDPVITPSGITYERKYIEEHLLRVGHFDPTTRTELTPNQLIPNYAMKEAVAAFLADNEWALFVDY